MAVSDIDQLWSQADKDKSSCSQREKNHLTGADVLQLC